MAGARSKGAGEDEDEALQQVFEAGRFGLSAYQTEKRLSLSLPHLVIGAAEFERSREIELLSRRLKPSLEQAVEQPTEFAQAFVHRDRKSTRLNSSHSG